MPHTLILYSLQNCPYAMRARMALFKAQQAVLIRAIKLDNKPKQMLLASPKGSVPVLVIESANSSQIQVIEESIEVMLWALTRHDPNNLLHLEDANALPSMLDFIAQFEQEFIPRLNAYSCAKRYHEPELIQLRTTCEYYLDKLEQRLTEHSYLFSNQQSLADIGVLPFVRKFARVEKQWFRQSPYPKLREWLNCHLQSQMFSKVMEDHELWLNNHQDTYLSLGKKL
ncbi:glutathione S-transferase [Vibrio gallicus]|uniref:glutathione S-transferase n=1 Tax=Vibrio gallicus TaxID=190897 RepID=UPI0021C3EFD3|nr:glutathione S-transferase [Vibrio gallicus]